LHHDLTAGSDMARYDNVLMGRPPGLHRRIQAGTYHLRGDQGLLASVVIDLALTLRVLMNA
jgi:hypothetical protein